jgi:hypothetical protein
MTSQTGQSKRCECADPGCPCCKGSCQAAARSVLFRVDMEDATGTPMCDGCGGDALDSGLFSQVSRDEAEAELDALDAEAQHECDRCGGELDQDCFGCPRCEECDGPCPGCYSGSGPGEELDDTAAGDEPIDLCDGPARWHGLRLRHRVWGKCGELVSSLGGEPGYRTVKVERDSWLGSRIWAEEYLEPADWDVLPLRGIRCEAMANEREQWCRVWTVRGERTLCSDLSWTVASRLVWGLLKRYGFEDLPAGMFGGTPVLIP